MYDKDLDEWWTISNTDPHWFDSAEPIWVTAGRQAKKTGSFAWIGSNVEIDGYRPDEWVPYKDNTDYIAAIDTVLHWFTEFDLDVVTLYIDQPDISGHDFGPAPDSEETVLKIEECDAILGYLIAELETQSLIEVINVIAVSDHGMTTCAIPEQTVNVYDYVPRGDIQVVADEGATVNILPTEGRTEAVYDMLQGAHPSFNVYYKEDVPERLHYSNSQLIHDIVVIADESWLMISVRMIIFISFAKGLVTKWCHCE